MRRNFFTRHKTGLAGLVAPGWFFRLLWRRYRGKSWVSTLWGFFAGQYVNLALAALVFVVKASPVWVWPVITRNILNSLSPVTAGSLDTIRVNFIVMLVLILQNIPLHTLHVYYLSKAVRSMQQQIRCVLVTRLQQLSISFHNRFTTGRMQSKILRDVEVVESLSRQMFGVVLNSVLSVVSALGVTLYHKPVIALFFLVAAPVAVLLVQLFRRPMDKSNREFRTEMETMTSMVTEMLEMIPVTRAHGVEEAETRRLGNQFQTLRRKALRVDLVNSVFGSSVWVCFQLFNLICIGVAAWMAVKGSIQAGDVVMYLGYFGMMVGSINGLVDFYPTLCLGRESLRSLSEILECPDLERNEGRREVRQVEGRIVLDRVEYRYAPGLTPAVQDVTLDIKPGESVAFVGESGSGKSTLMNLVIGFRRPTGGRILLDGCDMETLDMRTYRHYLAVVAQNTILFSGTVRENITYGLDHVDDKRLQEVLELANVSQFVRDLPKGLDTIIGEHGGRLSGGQRQRISIARAFIRDPRVIVLDEATSALDVVSEKLVQEAIQRLISRRTTLIVAHRLSTIRNADRVVVMNQGRIVEQGTHDELMTREGEFFRMVSLQK
jgi:ATP-binding cassette subfamily B protein